MWFPFLIIFFWKIGFGILIQNPVEDKTCTKEELFSPILNSNSIFLDDNHSGIVKFKNTSIGSFNKRVFIEHQNKEFPLKELVVIKAPQNTEGTKNYIFGSTASGLKLYNHSSTEGLKLAKNITNSEVQCLGKLSSEEHFYFVSKNHLNIISIQNTESTVGSFNLSSIDSNIQIKEMVTEEKNGNHKFHLVAGKNGYIIIEFNSLFTESNYTKIEILESNYYYSSVSIDSDHPYTYILEENTKTLLIFNIHNKSNPILLSQLSLSGTPTFLKSYKKNLIVSNTLGLSIINVNNASKPIEKSEMSLNAAPNHLELDETQDYFFIADGNQGIQIIDASNSSNLIFRGYKAFFSDGNMNSKHVAYQKEGNTEYLFVADENLGLFYINIHTIQVFGICELGEKHISIQGCTNSTNDCIVDSFKIQGICEGNFDISQDCEYCRNNWYGENCTSCDIPNLKENDCTSCSGNLDYLTGCKTCKNYWSNISTNCSFCPLKYNNLTGCSYCKNKWQYPETGCMDCPGNFDPEQDCKAGKCIDYWSGINCDVCPSEYRIVEGKCNETMITDYTTIVVVSIVGVSFLSLSVVLCAVFSIIIIIVGIIFFLTGKPDEEIKKEIEERKEKKKRKIKSIKKKTKKSSEIEFDDIELNTKEKKETSLSDEEIEIVINNT